MTQINEVEDPAAVIAVPTEEDIDVMERIIEDAYDDISDEYEFGVPTPPEVEREGSLCQEALAQLRKQTEDEE